ncbi:MAG TPA: hypothetical protein VJ300_05260 [Thermoplasmata archaeon]|nr:hypothetical protein [Thermoplasmata archaeon]
MTLEGYEGERVLLSYDVSGEARSTAARVCQIVFGRVRGSDDTRAPTRIQEGFIHRPGVVWIGQSVLVMPPRDAEELAARLRPLGVRVATGPVSIRRESLEAFRSPGRAVLRPPGDGSRRWIRSPAARG